MVTFPIPIDSVALYQEFISTIQLLGSVEVPWLDSPSMRQGTEENCEYNNFVEDANRLPWCAVRTVCTFIQEFEC